MEISSIKDVCNLLLNNTGVDFWIERLESTKFYKILDPNQGGSNINLNKIN